MQSEKFVAAADTSVALNFRGVVDIAITPEAAKGTVVLLLDFDGQDGGRGVVDKTGRHRPYVEFDGTSTANYVPQIDTAEKKYGAGSLLQVVPALLIRQIVDEVLPRRDSWRSSPAPARA